MESYERYKHICALFSKLLFSLQLYVAIGLRLNREKRKQLKPFFYIKAQQNMWVVFDTTRWSVDTNIINVNISKISITSRWLNRKCINIYRSRTIAFILLNFGLSVKRIHILTI